VLGERSRHRAGAAVRCDDHRWDQVEAMTKKRRALRPIDAVSPNAGFVPKRGFLEESGRALGARWC